MENKPEKDLFNRLLLSPGWHIYRHILLQAGVLCITLNSFWDVPDHLILNWSRFWGWVGYFLITDLVIYFNIYVLTSRFLLKNRLSGYLGAVGVLTLLAIIIVVFLQLYFQEPASGQRPVDYTPVILNLFSGILTLGLLSAGISALLLYRHWIGYKQKISELESNTLQSELKFLKSQINPHFLFNMLNNANVLIRKNAPEAAQVLFKLEDLLRYQFDDSDRESVSLSSEICFLNDFLSLEKIRRDDFSFQIRQEGDILSLRVPPLLFIPFAENAVKHNMDGEHESYVHLSFDVRDNRLLFCCKNSKPLQAPVQNSSGGLGLKNIRRRLELLFPDKHTLEIEEEARTYVVRLNIVLN